MFAANFKSMVNKIKAEEIISIAKLAGEAILNIYNDPAKSKVVYYKGDDSPLTLADEASHKIIVKGLEELYPEVPIISEEGRNHEYKIRQAYSTYWLVDPLDGTKEFINRNGQFTVNIALIINRQAVAGFVYTPVSDDLYYGIEGKGAYKINGGDKIQLKVNNKASNRIAVRSKSHASQEEEGVLSKFNVIDSISVGSSLKFCMVAEGKADIYYRHGPTMEWDIAAGHAIVNAAGGKVFNGIGEQEFIYNKEELLNGSFLCLGFNI